MTKKDYLRIADAIRITHFDCFTDKAELVLELSKTLAEDNPKFDIHKFALACGFGA